MTTYRLFMLNLYHVCGCRCEPDASILFTVIVVFHLDRSACVSETGERRRQMEEQTEKRDREMVKLARQQPTPIQLGSKNPV